MPVQWAGLAPPLLVDVRRDAGLPLRAQLEAGLRDAIRSGRLPVGERLPSSRELARQLGRLPRPRAGVLRPAAGRGLPDQPRRVGARGWRRRRPPRPAAARRGPAAPSARARATATADRLRLRRARPRPRSPARTGRGRCARPAARSPTADARLRRPARRPAAARGAGGLRGPGARGRHRPRPRAGVLGVRPGRDARAAHARPRGLPPDRAREPRQRRPGAERVVPGGAADRRRAASPCPSTSTAWTSTRSPPPERRRSW